MRDEYVFDLKYNMTKLTDIQKELKKVNFDNLELTVPSRVVGRSKEWSVKLKINGSIYQIKWHYGVVKKKKHKYGHIIRYSGFPKAEKLNNMKLYKIDYIMMNIEISDKNVLKITEIDFKENEYSGKIIPVLKKIK